MKNNQLSIAVVVALLLVGGAYYFSTNKSKIPSAFVPDQALAAKFDVLSKKGNSSCSAVFMESIDGMADTDQLQGSCCSPMDMHRYSEQVTGLQKYKDIKEIPSDPYDINAGLAKQMIAYYDTQLTPDEQKAYDYAMANSMKKALVVANVGDGMSTEA